MNTKLSYKRRSNEIYHDIAGEDKVRSAKPKPPPTEIMVSAMWMRRQKCVCVVDCAIGRSYLRGKPAVNGV